MPLNYQPLATIVPGLVCHGRRIQSGGESLTHSIEGRETLVWKIPDTVSVPKEVKGLEMSTEGLEMKGVIR
jgi:hypothetical protein